MTEKRAGFITDNSVKDNYQALENILEAAYNRAAYGKGRERHASGEPFEEQPIIRNALMLESWQAPLYQALKKIQETGRLPIEDAVNELLDAIVYIAASVYILENHTSFDEDED